jgi:hypothetical protein
VVAFGDAFGPPQALGAVLILAGIAMGSAPGGDDPLRRALRTRRPRPAS